MYDYYGTSAAATSVDTEIMAAIMGFLATYAIVIFLIAAFMIIVNWVLFKKANKPGWAAIIPIYNIVVKYQIAKVNPLLIILLFIPIINFVATIVLGIIVNINLAKVFGKGGAFAVGLIFLPIIFLPILAFGKAEYKG